MSGGKGGSQTSEVSVPQYIEDAARRNLQKADMVSEVGYAPNYGPDVAAFTPAQLAAMMNTNDTASAFGLNALDPGSVVRQSELDPNTVARLGELDPGSVVRQSEMLAALGIPTPTEYAGGVLGYSSMPLYEQALEEFRASRPGQAEYIDSFFVDPVTGEPNYAPPAPPVAASSSSGSSGPYIPPPAPDYVHNGQSYKGSDLVTDHIAGAEQPGILDSLFFTPTVSSMANNAGAGSVYNPTTGGYDRTHTAPGSSLRPRSKAEGASTSFFDKFRGPF